MKCLIAMAHCDDELLWAHPWLLSKNTEKKVLICSSDLNNPERQEYKRGPEALAEVCRETGVSEFDVQNQFFSEFYRLRTRGQGNGPLLMDWWNETTEKIAEMSADCDFIVTHSPHGAYGHLDHLMVYRAVMETSVIPVYWTDQLVKTSTWPVGVGWLGRHCYGIKTPKSEFDRLKQHYVDRNCWTWSSDEPLIVSVHRSDSHFNYRKLMEQGGH